MEGPEAAPSPGAWPQLGGPVLLPAQGSQSVVFTNQLRTSLPHSGDLLRACSLPVSSTPSTVSCKESCAEFLPFAPERTRVSGEPPEVLGGDISLEGCQGQRAKGTQIGWNQVGWFERKQHCGCEERCNVGGKRRNAEILERNQLPLWCSDPPPQSYLGPTRQTLRSNRSHLAAGCPLPEEGRGIWWCQRGRSPFSNFQIRASGEKKSDLRFRLLLQPPLGFSHFLGEVSMTERRLNQGHQ